MKSKTFEQAKKFYEKNSKNLIETLHHELHGKIDYQVEYDQVAVWFDGFALCYQNSDMNGKCKGEPHFDNNGANNGLDDLLEILKNDDRFNALIADDEYWKNEYLREFINNFCADFAKKHKIADYFECNQS